MCAKHFIIILRQITRLKKVAIKYCIMICIPIKKYDISNIVFHLYLKVLKKKKNGLLLVKFSRCTRSEIFWLKYLFLLEVIFSTTRT